MKKILSIVLAIFLVGCAGAPIYHINTPQKFSIPPVNEEVTITLGSNLLSQGVSVTHNAVDVTKPVSVSLTTLLPNTYIEVGQVGDKAYYESIDSKPSFSLGDSLRLLISKNKKLVCLYDLPTGAHLESTDCSSLDNMDGVSRFYVRKSKDETSFRKTLIYTGKVGNRIRFSYREFHGATARPSFTTDVEYDLNEGDLISYQGATIKIVEANNQKITYIVKSNFGEYQ
ncbi:MAG: hypothetical protein ACJAS1_005192 [Oleiphilaceae bacterium]|jgi:hypothetical protein